MLKVMTHLLNRCCVLRIRAHLFRQNVLHSQLAKIGSEGPQKSALRKRDIYIYLSLYGGLILTAKAKLLFAT